MQDVVKKVFSKEDYLASLYVRFKVFVEEQKVPLSLEIDEFEKQPTDFLLFYNGKVVGTCRYPLKASFLKIERLAILKAFRGKNLGAKLLKFVQEDGLKNHPTYLQMMHAQAYALKFYEKLGWEKIGEKFSEADIEHYLIINFIHDKDFIKKLKCLNDPKCPKDIKDYLLSFLKK